MPDYNFTLPFPPSVGGMWRAYQSRFILSKRGRQYRKDAISAIEELGLSGLGISDRLSVTITLNPPTLARRDVDNYPKAILDSLSHAGFWLDDEQIDRLLIMRGEKVKGGNVEISINIL